MNQLPLFSHIVPTGPATKTDKQILALVGKARKYPSAKKKIKEVRERKEWANYLSK